jgi:hypothetical protein
MRRDARRAPAGAVKVAHVATVDLSLRFLLLEQLESLRESGYQVTGISSGPALCRRCTSEKVALPCR